MSKPNRRVAVHGHRGARAIYPENTLPAFEYAIACGVDALELDLAVTRDNVLVVSHDPAMNPAFCRGPAHTARVISEMTLAQLRLWDCGAVANPAFPRQHAVPGTRVPTFAEVLALAPHRSFHFNVETKSFPDRPHLTPPPAEFARLVYEAVAAPGLQHRLILQSFDFRTLEAMRHIEANDASVRLSALFDIGSAHLVERSLAIGAHIISPHLTLVSKAMVERAHESGLEVVPWTANTPAQWRAIIEASVDGIITDDPAALIAYLRDN